LKKRPGRVECAIAQVLRKHPKGIRYNALKKESDKMLRSSSGKGLCIRTFDKHLKGLVGSGFVERNEVTRFKVFYKLRIAETELKELRSLTQQTLLSWRESLSTTLELSKALVHAGCKEKAFLKSKSPEIETYMEVVCEDIVEMASKLTEFGLLMILAFEADKPVLSRFMAVEFGETLEKIFIDAADWIEKAGEGQFLLTQFFQSIAREIQAKSPKELVEKRHVRRKELEKIARKLRDEGV